MGTVIIMATDLEQLTGESYLVLAYILRNSCQARMIRVLTYLLPSMRADGQGRLFYSTRD